MLKIEGMIGEKFYESETTVSAKDVVKALFPSLLGKKNIELRKHVKTDQFGQDLYPVTYAIPTRINVAHPNMGTFSLRYFETSRPIGNGMQEYLPLTLTFGGRSLTFDEKNIDQAILFLLAKECEQSPVGGQAKKVWYHYDPDADAEKKMVAIESIMDFFDRIKNAGDDEIKMRALGIRIGNETVSPQPNPTLYRHELFQLLQKHGEKFMAAWNNAVTIVRGAIFDARNTNLIKMEVVHGVTKFIWTRGPKENQVIHEFNSTSVDIEQFINAIRSAPNSDDTLEYIRRYSNPAGEVLAEMTEAFEAEAPAELSSMEGENAAKGLAENAIRLNVVVPDFRTKSVVCLDKLGVPETNKGEIVEAVSDIKDMANWKEELIAALKEDSMLRNSFRLKIRHRQK